ncbi:hypothetical protein ABIA35_009748 [Catenulispora sp. MAP12-49]|uniref:hypothetical protein n=1 Tax=Catenulispora sp. MAP12-49 TaxID=3156302 RepID=UPI003515A737
MSDAFDKARFVIDFPYSDMDTWVVLRKKFPSGGWDEPEPWAEMAAGGVYAGFAGTGSDVPMPDPAWIDRTAHVILSAREQFTGGNFLHSMLMFYEPDRLPIPVGLTVYAAELPWKQAIPVFAGEHDPENVSKPVIEDFRFAAEAVGVRAIRYTHLDPTRQTIMARAVYYFRRAGVDTQVMATFVDPSAMKDALPKLDAFVGKLAVYVR